MKNRKRNRFQGYDYSQPGYYFVTICVKDHRCAFGKIIGEEIILSELGKVAKNCWQNIPEHFKDISLDEFIIMPNHIHGIVVINPKVGNKNFCSLQKHNAWQSQWARSLSSVVRGFKIGVTKWCRQNGYENFAWQKSFYDHVIRSEESLDKIRRYVRFNHLKWEIDKYYQM